MEKPNNQEKALDITSFSETQLEQLKNLFTEMKGETQIEPKRKGLQLPWGFGKGNKSKEQPVQKVVIRREEDDCPFEQWLIIAEHEEALFEQEIQFRELEEQIQEIEALQLAREVNRAEAVGFKRQINIDKILDW